MSHTPTYRFLNLERGWPLFERHGVEIGEDGSLRLARLPRLEDVGDPLPPIPGLEGPLGIGADACGNVYIADPANHRILRLGACEDVPEPLPCLNGPGAGPGRLHSPRGVTAGPRDALYIADSRNARIVVVDLETGQVRGYWDGRGRRGAGAPFAEPWDLAADAYGRVYVADPGAATRAGGPLPGTGWRRAGGSVRRFDAGGEPDTAFGQAIARRDVRPLAPASVAIAVFPGDDAERLLVIDTQPYRLLIYDLDGGYDAAATQRWARAVGDVAGAGAGSVAVTHGVLYITDPGGGRVLAFDAAGAFLGAVTPPGGAVAGIGVDCRGRLFVHPGGGDAIRRATGEPSFASCGSFIAGPFRAATDPTRWQRLRIDIERLPEGTHFRIFTLTSDTLDGGLGNRPAPPDCAGATAAAWFAAEDGHAAPLDSWRAAPRDAADLLALNQPGEYLWVAGVLQGDGSATPALQQIRLHHDEDGWLRYLPRIYARAAGEQPFLRRALALFETALDDEEALIDALPRLFDAAAAPDHRDAPWLDWLAGWVDVPLDEKWPDALRRGVVADAFAAHARRGTRASLRRAIRLYAGATALIEEAQPEPPAWSLGHISRLGFETRLAPEAAEGAVLDRTAVADHSHLAEPGDFGPPLFAETAHRFHVAVYATGDARATLDRVRSVTDREKPAHTTYLLCAIRARMRVGVQARLGIDAIVGGAEAPAARLDGATELGRDTTLAASTSSIPMRSRGDAMMGAATIAETLLARGRPRPRVGATSTVV